MEQSKPSQPQPQEETSAFGDWDIRREQNVRPKVDDSAFDNAEKKDFETFHRDEPTQNNDDELNTPPFFRRKR